VLKRLIAAITVALLIVGGLWLVLFISEADSFTELLDKLINDGFAPARVHTVEVGFRWRDDHSLPDDVREFLELYFFEYHHALGAATSGGGEFFALYDRHSVSRAPDLLALDYEIEMRRRAGLKFDSCLVTLQLLSVSFGDDEFVELRLLEGIEQVTEHFFVLDRRNKTDWRVWRHTSDSPFALYITAELERLVRENGQSAEQLEAFVLNEYAAQLRIILQIP
jgi:hypothetical protein